jgi:hypothetical protein
MSDGSRALTQIGWRPSSVHAGRDLDDDDRGDDPVDDHAERRPPSGVGDDVAPVLPQVLANSRVDIARAIEQADNDAVDLPDRR